MATYEYSCKDCKTTITVERLVDAVETIPDCEYCGHKLTRVYSWGNTTFKGKGFYSTDKGDN